MKLTFIGTGYVGLVTGACMAELGHTVICADIDTKKIAKLKRGVMPIYEAGLAELVEANVNKGRLSFTTDLKKAIQASEVIFSAVGTPENPKTGAADLQYVYAVAKSFAQYTNGYKVFVNKSTVPVGTGREVNEIILRSLKTEHEFDVVSNPEFLREGAAIKDFLNPDRIVVGVSTERAEKVMRKIYQPLIRANRPLIVTDILSAELIKYAANAFLATKISFINEVARFCSATGANVKEVAKGIGADNRIGSRFLAAGAGYGGSCFPKDIQALIQSGKKAKSPFGILAAVDKVNDAQKILPFTLLKRALKGDFKNKKVAILGLSFKPRTDDVREAPALYVIEALAKAGATVEAYDPVAGKMFVSALKKYTSYPLKIKRTAYAAVTGADAVIILTEWDEFRSLDLELLAKKMKGNILIDGRNIINPLEAEHVGLVYRGIGI